MDFTTTLVVLGLIGTVWSVPITCPEGCTATKSSTTTEPTCPEGCTVANSSTTTEPTCPTGCTVAKSANSRLPKIMSGLPGSVAPWNLESQTEEGREPHSIEIAKCNECSIDGMDAKPITITIYVYKQMLIGTGWCKCDYDLPVGCTCVKKQEVASS